VRLLLDTNVLSELRKGPRTNARVRAWFESIAEEEVCLSVLVIGELRRGVELLRKRDGRQAAALERWLERVLAAHAERILPVDESVASEWGRMMAIRPGSVIDTLLAATAQVHSLLLVTRNVKDVAWTGVRCLDPFQWEATD